MDDYDALENDMPWWRYMAIYNDEIFYGKRVTEVTRALEEHGINFSNIQAEKSQYQTIPYEKQQIKIKDEFITLPKYIFQAKIYSPSPIAYGNTKSSWLVLGGITEIELQSLVNMCSIKQEVRSETELTSEDKSHRHSIPDDVQIFVWNRDGGKCVRCGSNTNLEFDHIIPLSRGGSNTARNLQLLCETCNRKKGNTIGG